MSWKGQEKDPGNKENNATGFSIYETDQHDRTRIRKRDWTAALVILVAAGCLLLLFRLTGSGTGNYAEVRIDGVRCGTYSLKEENTFTVKTAYGKNVVEIRDGAVSVIEADCEGHDCMRQGKISRCNETIVCLPHKLVIEITREQADKDAGAGFDTVAK